MYRIRLPRRQALLACTALSALCSIAGPAIAEELRFDNLEFGANSGSWFTATNWTTVVNGDTAPGRVPLAGDDAFIPNLCASSATSCLALVNLPNAVANTVTLEGPSSFTPGATLEVTGGGSLTVGGLLTANAGSQVIVDAGGTLTAAILGGGAVSVRQNVLIYRRFVGHVCPPRDGPDTVSLFLS